MIKACIPFLFRWTKPSAQRPRKAGRKGGVRRNDSYIWIINSRSSIQFLNGKEHFRMEPTSLEKMVGSMMLDIYLFQMGHSKAVRVMVFRVHIYHADGQLLKLE
ncbi:hypothetical protein SAMN04488054_10829 [Salibacterium qingdaonense]|uniref:Uncharacterized protein n=2 Tax=Salibacterium TaxID=1884429 RepID=A0A1I4LKQ1_9BACI|nr:hypothetical protein SAMN04488054_10829 [Salibacterium qingdaonense]SFP68779.1 hypothetical protein SAMN05518683_108142 [Salibacterium halotolerans]